MGGRKLWRQTHLLIATHCKQPGTDEITKGLQGSMQCIPCEHNCKMDYQVNGFECDGCSNTCEVIEIKEDGRILARYGDKCGKWSNTINNRDSKLA